VVQIRQEPYRHTNGHPFESVTFACGCVVKWIPNFSGERVESACPKRPFDPVDVKEIEGFIANAIDQFHFKPRCVDEFHPGTMELVVHNGDKLETYQIVLEKVEEKVKG
jgi:hypothetical protein